MNFYWITKCTTTGYFFPLFPRKGGRRKKKNEVAKPVLYNFFTIQSIFTFKFTGQHIKKDNQLPMSSANESFDGIHESQGFRSNNDLEMESNDLINGEDYLRKGNADLISKSDNVKEKRDDIKSRTIDPINGVDLTKSKIEDIIGENDDLCNNSNGLISDIDDLVRSTDLLSDKDEVSDIDDLESGSDDLCDTVNDDSIELESKNHDDKRYILIIRGFCF